MTASIEKILLIEDNHNVAVGSKMMLQALGFEVSHVDNATDALKQFELKSFDLVFSDISLPGIMDGISLARTIRARRPDMPIILATGYADHADRAREEFVVLQKPYDLTEFRNAVRSVTQR